MNQMKLNQQDKVILFSGVNGAGRYSMLRILFVFDDYNKRTFTLGNYKLELLNPELFQNYKQQVKNNIDFSQKIISIVLVLDISFSGYTYDNQILFVQNFAQLCKQMNIICNINILLHKTDKIQQDKLFDVSQSYRKVIQKIFTAFQSDKIIFYETNIWDESLYKSWCSINQQLTLNLQEIKEQLGRLCQQTNLIEIGIIEKNSYLLVACSKYEPNTYEKYEKLGVSLKNFKYIRSMKENDFKSITIIKKPNYTLQLTYFEHYILLITLNNVQCEGLLQYNERQLSEYLNKYLNV